MTTREFSSGPPGYYGDFRQDEDGKDSGDLVKEIYDTVNSLNNLVAKAVKEHGFSVFWDILEIREVQDAFPRPHLNMTVMTKVE